MTHPILRDAVRAHEDLCPRSPYPHGATTPAMEKEAMARVTAATLGALYTWLIEDPEEGGVGLPEGVTQEQFDAEYRKGYEWVTHLIAEARRQIRDAAP